MSLNLGQAGMFLAYSQVHTQYTKESVVELLRELTDVCGERPIGDEELADGKAQMIKSYPQFFQSIGGIAGQLNDLVLYDQPLDEWRTYERRVRNCDAAQVAAIAREHLDPEHMQIVVIGDREKIEAGLRELDLGEIAFLDGL